MDLYLEILPNPNCDAAEGMLYQALEPPRTIRQVRISRQGREQWCWVTGVEPPVPAERASPRWGPAQVQKITDSGAGIAFCIYGGQWGLRFQLAGSGPPAWSLQDPAQWGEPYKIYGALEDLLLEPEKSA